MLLLMDEYRHNNVKECPVSVLYSTEEYMDDENPYVRFRKMFLVKGMNLDSFRVKPAKVLFDGHIGGLISLKESEFKQNLHSILNSET